MQATQRMKTYCLTPTNDHLWILTLAGTANPLATFRSKDRALEEAIDLADSNAGALELHYADGTVATGHAKVRGQRGLHCYSANTSLENRPSGSARAGNRHGRKHRRKKGPARVAA